MSSTTFLQKFFDENAHKRAKDGKFTLTGSTIAGGEPAPVEVRPEPKRSITRGELWQRIGAKLPGLPEEYTGSKVREKPLGSFDKLELKAQRPKAVSPKDDKDLRERLRTIAKENRMPTITRAQERHLIPEGSDRKTVHRAYSHAAMLALHDYGTHDYDFSMPPDLQEEMRPLEGFIRYARGRLKSTMLGTEKGGWRPYRKEFGKPFKDLRRDKQTGEIRLRNRANHVLIKFDEMPREDGPRSFRVNRKSTGMYGGFRLSRRSTGALGGLGRLPRLRPIRFAPSTPKMVKVDPDSTRFVAMPVDGPRFVATELPQVAASCRSDSAPGVASADSTRFVATPAHFVTTPLAKRVHPLVHELVPAKFHKHVLPPKKRPVAPEAKAALSEADAILAHARTHADPGHARHRRSALIADHKTPLHHALR